MVWVTNSGVKGLIQVHNRTELRREFKAGESVIIGNQLVRGIYPLATALCHLTEYEERGIDAWSAK
jgi:hypothetical protein